METISAPIPKIPNSCPPKGNNATIPPTPNNVNIGPITSVPQEAHPTPSIPLINPPIPIEEFFILSASLCFLMKYITIATLMPSSMDIAII